jgi:dihydrofolate synthase/folylpolyglutamate synthase
MSAGPLQLTDNLVNVAGPVVDDVVAEFIGARINFERLPTERYDLENFKLDRMRQFLHALGNPQRALPVVHVAGTKGKGSTASMTASILTQAGFRVGLFTSPHIEHFAERMTVAGDLPAREDLVRLVADLKPVVEELDRTGAEMRPTFFEVLTAMAWLHFRRQQVDCVVLEVGLGGRLDATNVCDPAATVITSISRDHERLLGSTLGEIAREKAGIIKPGVPVFHAVDQPEPRQTIEAIAASLGSPVYAVGDQLSWSPVHAEDDVPSSAPQAREGPRVRRADYPTGGNGCDGADGTLIGILPKSERINVSHPWGGHQGLSVPLAGVHQARNALLAVSVCDYLDRNGFPVPGAAIRSGLRDLRWPLRIEVVGHRPLVIVDAAHNDGSVDCLIATLADLKVRRRILIFGTSRDKNAAVMLDRLGRAFDEVILTQYIGNPRRVPVDMLREVAAAHLAVPFDDAETPTLAWERARARAGSEDLICTTGSFFLAAEMRGIILPRGT